LPQPSPPPPPNKNPTIQPTITPRPTGIPPASPSDYPSGQPFFSPTAEPTFSQEISVNIAFNQRFQIGNELEFNETEQDWQTMAGYTDDFGGRDDGRVNSTCGVISQRLQIIGGKRRQIREEVDNSSTRLLQGVVFNQVEYAMTYRSNHTSITSYPTLFQNYVNADLDRLTTDLQNAGLAVMNSFLAFNNIATLAPTTLPTISPRRTDNDAFSTSTCSDCHAIGTVCAAPKYTCRNSSACFSTRTKSFIHSAIYEQETSIKMSAIVVTMLAGLSATAFILMIYLRLKRDLKCLINYRN
jgi:hypothetical protein